MLKLMTTKKSSKVPDIDKVRYKPSHAVNNYSEVSLYNNAMHINFTMFLVSVSKYIGLI